MVPSDPSDEDLIRRAREGDETAAQALFDRWLPEMRARVRSHLRGAMRRRVGESDVIQEAYLTAFLKMDDFEDRGDGSFGRWLAKILEWKIKQQVRHHLGTGKRDARLETPPPVAGIEAAVPSPGPTPSLAASGREDRDRVEAAIRDLPEQYQTVLRLVYADHLPLAEVGRITGRSAAAAGALYARALQALAKRMQAGVEP